VVERAEIEWGRQEVVPASWSLLRIASSAAMGCSVALAVYAALQLAAAMSLEIVRRDPDDVPLFFRWRMAILVGAVTTLVSCIVDVHRRVPWLATWALGIACVVTAVVVGFAP
jgi:hypothetical protein